MNMNAILKPNFKKNKINNIEDSSNEEDPKIKDMEQALAQTLENIKKVLTFFQRCQREIIKTGSSTKFRTLRLA